MERNKVMLNCILFLLTSLICVVRAKFPAPQEFVIELDHADDVLVITSNQTRSNGPSTFVDLGKGLAVFADEDGCYVQKLRTKKLLVKMRQKLKQRRKMTTNEMNSAFSSDMQSMVGLLLGRFRELYAVEEVQLKEREVLLGRRENSECKGKAVWRTSKRQPSLPSYEDYLKSYNQNRTAMTHSASIRGVRTRRDVENRFLRKAKRNRKLVNRKRRRKNQRRNRSRIQADDSSVSSSRARIDDSSYISSLNFPHKEAKGFRHYEDFHRESPQPNANSNPSDPLFVGDSRSFDLPVDSSSYLSDGGDKIPQGGYTGKVNQEIEFPKMILRNGTIFYRHDAEEEIKDDDTNGANVNSQISYGNDGSLSDSSYGSSPTEFIPEDSSIGESYIPLDIDGRSVLFPKINNEKTNPVAQEKNEGFLNENLMPSGFDFITEPISDAGSTDHVVSAIAYAKRDNGMSTLAIGEAGKGGYFQASAHGYDDGDTSHSQVEGDQRSASGVASMTTADQEGKTLVQLLSPYATSAALSNVHQGNSVSSAFIEKDYLEGMQSISLPINNVVKPVDDDSKNGIYNDVLPLQLPRSVYESEHNGISRHENEFRLSASHLKTEPNPWQENTIQTIDLGGLLVGAGQAPRESEIQQINTGIFSEGGYGTDYKLSQLKTDSNHWQGKNVQTIDKGGLVSAGHAPRESEVQQVKTGVFTDGDSKSKTDKKDGVVGLVTYPYGEVGIPPGPGELLQQNVILSLDSGSAASENHRDTFYDDYLAELESEPIFSRRTTSIQKLPTPPSDNSIQNYTAQPYLNPSLYTTTHEEEQNQSTTQDNSHITSSWSNLPDYRHQTNEIFTPSTPLKTPSIPDGTINYSDFITGSDYSQGSLIPMNSLVVPVEIPTEEWEEPSMPVVPPGEEGTLQRLEPLNPDQPVINIVTLSRKDKTRALYQREGAELEPGEKIPGAPGFVVPPGFRGRVVYGHDKPVEIDSRKTVQGYNTNIRVQPQHPPGNPVYASISGPGASKHFLENQKAGVHITLGSNYPAATGHTHESSSHAGGSQRTHHSYQQPHGLVGPQIPGTNLDYNKVFHSPRGNIPRKSWTTQTNPRRTYSKSRNTKWSRSWSSGSGYPYQHGSNSAPSRDSCGYYTTNCKTTYGPFQNTKICRPLYIEVACCC